MYAAGKESPQRLPCQRFLERIVNGEGPAACTDTEVLQEILHRYRTLKIPEIGFQLFDAVTHLGIPILAVTDRVMAEARRLLEDHPLLSTRDCVHLGVMWEHGSRKCSRTTAASRKFPGSSVRSLDFMPPPARGHGRSSGPAVPWRNPRTYRAFIRSTQSLVLSGMSAGTVNVCEPLPTLRRKTSAPPFRGS